AGGCPRRYRGPNRIYGQALLPRQWLAIYDELHDTLSRVHRRPRAVSNRLGLCRSASVSQRRLDYNGVHSIPDGRTVASRLCSSEDLESRCRYKAIQSQACDRSRPAASDLRLRRTHSTGKEPGRVSLARSPGDQSHDWTWAARG